MIGASTVCSSANQLESAEDMVDLCAKCHKRPGLFARTGSDEKLCPECFFDMEEEDE